MWNVICLTAAAANARCEDRRASGCSSAWLLLVDCGAYLLWATHGLLELCVLQIGTFNCWCARLLLTRYASSLSFSVLIMSAFYPVSTTSHQRERAPVVLLLPEALTLQNVDLGSYLLDAQVWTRRRRTPLRLSLFSVETYDDITAGFTWDRIVPPAAATQFA